MMMPPKDSMDYGNTQKLEAAAKFEIKKHSNIPKSQENSPKKDKN